MPCKINDSVTLETGSFQEISIPSWYSSFPTGKGKTQQEKAKPNRKSYNPKGMQKSFREIRKPLRESG